MAPGVRVHRTTGNLRVQRELYRVHLTGAASLYVGHGVKSSRTMNLFGALSTKRQLAEAVSTANAIGDQPEGMEWYVSHMPYATVSCDWFKTREEALLHAKRAVTLELVEWKLGDQTGP